MLCIVTKAMKEEKDAVRTDFRDNQLNLRVQENLSGGSEYRCDIKDGYILI